VKPLVQTHTESLSIGNSLSTDGGDGTEIDRRALLTGLAATATAGAPPAISPDLKAAFADPACLNRSFASRQGADELGMDDSEVVAVIQALILSDFEKSMTAMADHKIWQDVYKPKVGGRTLYVKFTLDAQQALFLISFKEA
jgi:motility quorum-sensing regulator / GCU-specific mRNA interferase toxin